MDHRLKFFAALPQFHASWLDGSLIDMETGMVAWFDDADDYRYKGTIRLRWPGQSPDVVCRVDLDKFRDLQVYRATKLGMSHESILAADRGTNDTE